MTDGGYAYHGEHGIMYRIIESRCTAETDITFYVSYMSILKKFKNPHIYYLIVSVGQEFGLN